MEIQCEFDEKYYKELCAQIDYFGEDSLTEYQQYLYHLWNNNLMEECKTMKNPIPKSMENKIRDYVKYQQKANALDDEIRHWLYKNNYDRTLVDMLIDSGQCGEVDDFIKFLNGEPDRNGFTIENFYNDNSEISEEEYL